MENKYYIPNIEDIRVGYYGEYNNWGIDERGLNFNVWDEAILSKINVEVFLKYGIKNFRVPFLTKEQIEAEGWTVMNTGGINPGQMDGRYVFSKGNYFLIWEEKYNRVDINLRDPSLLEDVWNPERFRVILNCPSINEFRNIVKLLP
jgi:hypothetical protein